MVDLRLTGRMYQVDVVDVYFRTDMINTTDTNFNILQIQNGRDFTSIGAEEQDAIFQKYFANTFKRENCSMATVIQFCLDWGLTLRAYVAGVPTNLLPDSSVSYSQP